AMTSEKDKDSADASKCTFVCTHCGQKYEYALNYQVREASRWIGWSKMLFEFDLADDDVIGDIQPDGSIKIRIPLNDQQYQNAKNVYVTRTENGRQIQVPAEIEDGYLVITANHFSPYEISFIGNDTHCFVGHSLTLKGDIGVNYYVDLPKGYNPADVDVDFSWNQKTVSVPLSQITQDTETGYYVVPCNVASKEMTDTIIAALKCNGEIIDTEAYSVEKYAKRIIENKDGEFDNLFPKEPEKLEKLQNLVTSMLVYGAKSQLHFDHNSDALADSSLGDYSLADISGDALTSYTYQDSDFADYGLKFEGSRLKLMSKTDYMLYFSKTGGDDKPLPKVTTDSGSIIEPYEDSGYICYDVTDIPAKCITDDITLYFNGNAKVFNTGSYIGKALNGDDNTLITTITALYAYCRSAKAYFDN
ncbi:MAG TPA: hypothetical protein DEO32_04000, partial [Ruminococcaceae bacterium]|nr:hypothetical protein [Oscillospiraceae bacterium]